MCPDAELLSAWTDGEVPLPWAERIATHLGACAACASKVESFRRLSGFLGAGAGPGEAAVVARIRERLDARPAASGLGTAPATSASRGRRPSLGFQIRRGRLHLPLPAAAAAALLILLAGGLSGGLLGHSSGIAKAGTSPAAASLASASSSSSATMDLLVRYLEAQNAQVNVTIQLPSTDILSTMGDPMILRTPPGATVALPPPDPGSGFVMSGGDGQGQ